MFYQRRSEKEIKAEKRKNMIRGAVAESKKYAEATSEFVNENSVDAKLGLAVIAVGALVGAVKSSKKEVKTRTGFWK